MLRKSIKISPRITVGPQPSEEMLEGLAEQGFKSVMNLSKKGELGQVLNPIEEQAAVVELGMEYIHIPTSLSTVKESQIEEACRMLGELPTPIYIHCRIGQRCGPFAMIYHAMRKKLSPQQALIKAEKLGLEWRAPMISKMLINYLEKHGDTAKQNA